MSRLVAHGRGTVLEIIKEQKWQRLLKLAKKLEVSAQRSIAST